jgi:hypothetical protein
MPGTFRPFDENDLATVDNVVPAKVREVTWSIQPVKIKVIDGCAPHFILVHERERRAGHILANSNTATDRLRECRLSSAELALQRDERRRLQLTSEVLSPRAKLFERDIVIGDW